VSGSFIRISGNIAAFAWKKGRKVPKSSIMTSCAYTDIWTRNLPNM